MMKPVSILILSILSLSILLAETRRHGEGSRDVNFDERPIKILVVDSVTGKSSWQDVKRDPNTKKPILEKFRIYARWDSIKNSYVWDLTDKDANFNVNPMSIKKGSGFPGPWGGAQEGVAIVLVGNKPGPEAWEVKPLSGNKAYWFVNHGKPPPTHFGPFYHSINE